MATIATINRQKKTNRTVTLKNAFQALNWSIRILNDGIFSKPG